MDFDIFTIDKKNKKLYATKVDNGKDREWNYEETWTLSSDM